MTRTLKIATLLVLALCVSSVAVAQSTSEVIVHKTGTVVAKYGGKVAVQMADGTIQEFTPKPGKTVMVDGVATTYETLKVGTVLAADFVKTETTTPITTTTIKNAKVMKVAGNTVIVQNSDGTYKKHTVPSGFKFLVDGKEVAVQDLREGMNLTATIVSTKTETTTASEIKGVSGVAPAAPAPAPAPMAAPAPAPAPEPPPAPEPKLPKTGSPLPLAALGGALSLLAGLGVRSFRRSR
jgi:LPXTG-motif cell wall-anchored protein